MDVDSRQLYEKTTSCIFPCNITSILGINCRAKAESLLQRFGSHSRQNVIAQASSSESQPLAESDFDEGYAEIIKSNLASGKNAKLVRQLFNIDGLRSIHVVTSEPTLHLYLERSEHNTQISHSDPEQDSDMYYDFDLASPEDTSRSGFSSNGVLSTSYENKEDCESKTAESGCVTSVGSPILFNDDHNSTLNNQPSTGQYSYFHDTGLNIDLNAVNNILTSPFQLAFKSFSDDDCNIKLDFQSLPHRVKSRNRKERRRIQQALKTKCPNCLNADKHHSCLCHMRPASLCKYVKHDSIVDSKSEISKERKRPRSKNKSKLRKSRTDHVVKSSSSDSHESSESSSSVNVFWSPISNKYSRMYNEDNYTKQIKQDAKDYLSDIADSVQPMYTQCQQASQLTFDNDVILLSHDDSHMTPDIENTFNISVDSFSKECSSLDRYDMRNHKDDEVNEMLQKVQSLHSNEKKKKFEWQKAKHMEKTYKSLERKLPTKDMSYVDIEISDDIVFKPSNTTKSNTNKLNYPRDSKYYAENSVLPLYVCSRQGGEQVAANTSQRHVHCANSQNKISSDNVRCAVSSYGYVSEKDTIFKDYNSVVCDYGYSPLSDNNLYLNDSNSMLPTAMHKSEGQTKVKKNIEKARTNGNVDEVLKSYCDNDNNGESKCPDSHLITLKTGDKSSNDNNTIIAKAEVTLNTAISNSNEGLKKEELPNFECHNIDYDENYDLNNDIKLPILEMGTNHVSVRPKTYFNRSRRSCKTQYNMSSNSSNGTEIDTEQYEQPDHSLHIYQKVEGEKLQTTSLQAEPETNNLTSDTTSSDYEICDSVCLQRDSILNETTDIKCNPVISKYYGETSIEKFLNVCGELDGVEILAENDKNNDYDEEDEDDIVLTGKFKNVMNYSEKVANTSDDELHFETKNIIFIDDSNFSNNDESICRHDIQNEINDAELISELSQLQLSGKDILETNSTEVLLQINVSTLSCEIEPSDSNEQQTRIVRSSSLKCGKTPPGTPGRKKIVRFADVLGLDLADVRTFLEGVPDVPKSAFCDLQVEDEAAASLAGHGHNVGSTVAMAVSRRMLTAMFQQPGSLPDFLDRVRYHKVSLENLTIGDDLSVRGIVRVYNIDFHKSVYVRYTFDHWRNHHETQAAYVRGSSDGFSDRFSFLLWGSFLQCNGALIFCIRYCTKGQQFWDNNMNSNYVLQCYPAPPIPGRRLEGRPQNDTSVQSNLGEKIYAGSHGQFVDPLTTPEPWMKKFF